MDNFVKTLIEEVKSQGVFDEFRFNCCLADVDTKPAYQNVRNRVETAVNDFLAKQKWTPETNKVQLRERLRKHLLDSDVLDKGVDHIVDQVVNPKVATIFEPKIESIAYKYLGITRPPPPTNPPPRPPLLPAPPLPPYSGHHMGHMNGGNLLKVETTDSLLPTDLEQISPDSDRESINIKSESRDDIKEEDRPPGVDGDDFFDDDDDDAVSPPFEPVGSIKEETNNASLNTSGSPKDIKELVNESPDAGVSQSSQLSQVSSDSRLTIASMDVPQQTSANDSNMAANMSEEAQMPKFNENSIDGNNSSRQLHFDIKKDAITFEGTDRRNSLSESTNGGTHALSIEDSIMCEVEANLNNDNISTEKTTPKLLPEQPSDPLVANSSRESESIFAVFAELAPGAKVPKEGVTAKAQEPLLCGLEATPEEPSPVETEKKSELAKTPDEVATLTLPIASDEPKDDLIKPGDMTTSPASASSSSQTKKHSHSHSKDKDKRHHSHSRSDDKQRRKSRDREREKSRSKTSSSKHSSHNSSHSSSSKHRSSSSSKNEKTSTSTTSNRSTQESSSSSSKRSSLRHESSSHKKHKSSTSSSRSDRDRDRSRDSRESHSHSHSHHSRSHNGSGSSKRSDRDRERDRNKSSSSSTSTSITTIIQDDHNEEKAKLLKRNSNDSNDEGKPPGLMNKPLTESTDSQSKEKTATAKNGKDPETNGKSNGTNDNHNKSNDQATAELMAATNVIIVSDMLQQSTVNYVDINSAGQTEKIRTRIKSPTTDVAKESAEQSIESVAEEPKSKSPATVVETEIKTASKLPADQTVITHEVVAEEPAEDLVMEPVMNSSEEAVEEQVKELVVEPSGKPVEEQVKKPVDKPAKVPAVEHVVEPEIESVKATTAEIDVDKNVPLVSVSGKDSVIESNTVEVKDEPEPAEPTAKFELIKESTSSEETSSYSDFEISKPFTHFEDETNMFKERLLQIEQHIKDRRQLLSVISELEDTNCMRRSTSKRRLSSEASSSPKPHSSSSGSSSSCAGSPAKRARRSDAAKTSPTPSEVSVNSKENEELEKHQKDARTTKRLTQKQCQQQRYSNDDLYKPRPLLSQRSRRRGLDSIL